MKDIRFKVGIDDSKAARELAALNRAIDNLKSKINDAAQAKINLAPQLDEAKQKAEETAASVAKLKEQLAASEAKTNKQGKIRAVDFVEQENIRKQLAEQEAILEQQKNTVAELQKNYDEAARSVDVNTSALQRLQKRQGLLSKVVSGQRIFGGIGAVAGRAKDAIAAKSSQMKDGFSDMFKKGLKSALLFGVGLRTVTALVSKLRQYVTQAVSEFAKSDKETQGNINALKSSLTGLKASWGAAFAPVLNAVAPILQRLIAMLNSAAQAVAQFMAVLTGRGSFKKAVDSTGQLSDNLGGAAGNAKEAKKQLMGIDTLTVAQDTDSGGGGGGGSSATAFEDTAVDAESFPAKIAAAIKAGEWSKAATLLTGKLNEMIASVDWAGIGSQLGGYLDGALTFLAVALTTFDWMGLAGGIATFLSNVISSVDWRNLGILFTAKFRIILQGVVGFIQNFDWGAAMSALSQFAVGLLNGLTDAIRSIDWLSLGQTIWNATVDIIQNIDWAGIVSSIVEVFGAACAGLGLLLWGVISSAWQEVVNWWNENAMQDGEFVFLGLLQGLWTGVKNIGLWLWNNIIKPFIDGFKDGFGIHSPSTVMAEIGGNIMAGLKQGVLNKINNVIQAFGQLKQRITDKLKSLVDTAKNINWADIGTNIVNGIIDGLNRAWQWLTGAIQQMCRNLLQSAKNILGIHSPSKVFREQIGENIGAGIEEGLGDSEGGLTAQMRSISSGLIAEANRFSIGEQLANMGGFRMPAVAMGGVVPPNAFPGSGGYGISTELESKLDALLDRLTKGGQPIEIHTTVDLDRRKVGEAVYTYTEERNRGRGK